MDQLSTAHAFTAAYMAAVLIAALGLVIGFFGLASNLRVATINGFAVFLMGGFAVLMMFMMAPPSAKAEPWTEFSAKHHCKITEKRQGHSNGGIGLTTSGNAGVLLGEDTPDQTAYLCDDGVTYWRND